MAPVARTLYVLVGLTALLVGLVAAKNLYVGLKMNVTPLSRMNWDNVITKGRPRLVSIVHFYRSNDGQSEQFSADYKTVSLDLDGIYKFAAVDCDENYELCEKEGVTKFPTVRVYPPLPVPPFDHEGELSAKAVTNVAARYVLSNVITVTSANVDTFISDSPAVPKVLLFTDKKVAPLIFKALSKSFEKKLFFGLVNKEEETLMKRYGVKTTPQIVVIKANEKKPLLYTGEIKYQAIFDFLNVHSETFVAGGGSSQDSAATKAWLTEIVPELEGKSGKDICFGVENVLCVILVSDGKPDKEYIETLKEAHKLFDRKIDRGTKYNFMWVDRTKEAEFANIFGLESVPNIAILNPGRRKRFVIHPGSVTLDSLKDTFDKISGGDMRFTNLKGDLPSLKLR
eukprot:TRINITY_DN11211_c0_g1_i1.p1 TRINITY_DN11211_c0_g1~~TRINITY_DN11211_c0_g1_i1.p1  ORF type:complete len:398 (+),score=137.24 TRINITY_DN11211_c0_g1_i1:83-1276(+)